MKKIILSILFIPAFFSFINAQVITPFTQRTSQYTPGKTIYNVQGDFALIGNTNLTLVNYGDNTSNNNNMEYVDVDSDATTLNSSASTLELSTENGAIPECSNIVYAGLYWTGRAHDGGNSPMEFTVTKGGTTVDFNKREVLIKGPTAGSYTSVIANVNDIYYPETQHGQMYSAYAEVTDYVQANGIGEYFVANVALREGNGGGTGYYGGWAMIVIYENSKMDWRDVTIFDGHAYVAGQVTADFTIPVSGFNTVQSGNVDLKLGVVAGEGDRGISGDYFQIRDHSDSNWITLDHSNNSTNNFFNSSISTNGNPRNPEILNNTGLDISMFDVPNPGNSVVTNNQTSTSFRYGSTQDTYTIFMLAMSVDAYIPTPEAHNHVISIDGVPYNPGDPLIAEPGDEIELSIEVRNKGTEPIDSAELVLPIPFASEYVSSSREVYFTPAPSPDDLYFDPSEGANGSVVWEIGTLPLPTDPDNLLGKLTITIKVTEDCTILSNVNCDAEVVVHGHMNGIGQVSRTYFSNHSAMQGYEMSGICIGEPINDPFRFEIDEAAFVTANCAATPSVLSFSQCNIDGPIPITEVSGSFPAGSRFYNEYPVTSSSIEYNISNPFPAITGINTYYAVPPGSTSCFFEFTIEVLDLTSTPIASSPVEYCQNDIASPLTATASDPSYTLFYFTSPGGIPQASITPTTDVAGTTTYYVAEGISASCISENLVPIDVVVNPLPEAPTAASSDLLSVCFNETGNIELNATGGSGDVLNWYDDACEGTLIGTGNNLSIPAPFVTTTYYAAWENACGISSCAEVTVTVLPEINVNLSITAEIDFYNASTGEITVTAIGGTPPFTYSLNGGTPQASNVFNNLSAGHYTITVTDAEGCSETASITINNALEIIAVDDAGTMNGMSGGVAVTNVLSNDLLDGNPVDPADVDLSFVSSTDPNISLVGNDVVVAPGTPAGTYYLVYEICEIANPTNCDQATVTITVEAPEIIANDDSASGIDGTSGQNDVLNVFDNDLLNGSPVNPVDVTLTETVPDPTGTLTLNPDGSVDVSPFTPGGTYTLTYQICEVLNPTNCDDAIVTIEVIETSDVSIVKTHIDPSNLPVGDPSELIEVNPSVITAGEEIYYFLMVENFGQDNSLEVTIEDNLPAGISNPEFSLNFGNSWFPWGGTRYLIEFLYPGVNYVMIRGDVDPNATGTLTNTATIYSAVTTDPDLSNNESTVVTTILSSADLSLTKTALTSPVVIGGQIVYEITVTNYGPSQATDVIITDNIDPTIISGAEYSTDAGGSWTSPWSGNLNIGDLNNGASYTLLIRGSVVDATPLPNVDPIPNTASVTSSDPDPDLSNNEETINTPLNTDADVSIVKTGPATVVAGTQIQYSIQATNNSNTFDAENVHIHDVINASIIENAEYSPDGGITWLAWTGDYLIGDMTPLSSFELLIRGDVVSNHTGNVINTATVETDTPDSDNSNNTSTVITVVEVVADLDIVKIQIDPSILPLSQAQIAGNPNDVLINPVEITAGDQITYALFYGNNGPSNATNVIIEDILPGFIVDWEASACQAAYGPWPGSYNLGTIISGGNCVIIIRGNVLPEATGNLVNTAIIHSDDVTDPDSDNDTSTFVTPIQAMADLSITKTVDNSTPYVGDNVTFTISLTNNGPSEATNVQVIDQLPSGYTYVSHTVTTGNYTIGTGIWDVGTVSYPGTETLDITATVNVPGGNYQNIATITDLDEYDPDPGNDEDDETTNPINVIIANNDNADPMNGYTGAINILNVFDNDLLNGTPVIPADLILTETLADPTGNLTLNPDGSVDLAANTPAGTYTFTYQICEIADPSNCDDAIVTIVVEAPEIIANDDMASGVNGYDGQINVLNVFDNDLLNGNPVNPSEVNITETVADPTGNLTLNPDGSVDVAPGTPEGTYQLTYEICEIVNPTNCDDAIVIITVDATSIIANDDSATDVDGTLGVTGLLNVFDNDLLNGNPVNPAEVTLTETVADPTGNLTLNPDGTVDVAPGTPAGTYQLTYEICEILNPTNCDDAIVTITVIPGEIIANDDFASGINGYTGQTDILNVFNNDLLSGNPVNPADVILTETIADPTGNLTLNPDGSVDLAPGTPTGTYQLTYEICEILNPGNCDDAIVTITVGATSIIANDDYAYNVNGHLGETAVVTVFDNDLLNGNPVNPAEVILTETIPESNGYLSLNPDGTVDVAPGTPAGTYYLTYQICEVLNPSNCDDAQVFVTVIHASISAANDDFTASPVDCEIGGIAGNVLTNDFLDVAPVNFADVLITLTDNGGITGASIDANGDLNIPAGLAVGSYALSYQICEVINPTNCDDADITIVVQDFVNPTITCPADIIVNNNPDNCEATGVTITNPTTNDNCGVSTVEGIRSDLLGLSDPYPLGVTTITWTVTDYSGNTATCDQLVTVIDNQLPTITCPAPVAVNTDSDECTASGVDLGTPVVDDNCTVASVTNDAPATFPIGNTTVTWTVTDGSENIATCEQIVTVTDVELPTITCPEDINACSNIIELVEPDVYDNCGIVDVSNDAPEFFEAGTTTVIWTVTDVNGNIATCEQLVHVSLMEVSIEASSQVTCADESDAAISVFVEGAFGEVSYSLNGGTPQSSNSFEGLSAGTYTVLVEDENGCSILTDEFIINNPNPIEAELSLSANVSCFDGNDGVIEITASGGTGQLSYTLNGGSPQTLNRFENLVAGTYTVVVEDENMCSITLTDILIENPEPLSVSYDASDAVSCYGSNDAVIEVFVSGGTGDYLVELTNETSGLEYFVSTPFVFEDLSAGDYLVSVTDENACFESINITIGSPEELTLTHAAYCEAGIVGIELMAQGGNGNYQYSIDGGETWSESNRFENLVNNTTIMLIVSDENNCVSEIIEVPVESLNTLNASAEIISGNSCYGVSDASVQINIEGGVAPYAYTVNGEATYDSNLIDSLAAGDYVIHIQDGNECPAVTEVSIESSEEIIVDNVMTTNADCNGNSNGTAEIETIGGFGNFDYQWSDGSNSNMAFDLSAGTHTITITDSEGCEITYDVIIESDMTGLELGQNNVFTPNNDGINDFFVISNLELYPDNELVILNRWGNEVYSKKSYDNLWDGSNLSEGTYFYILKVKICDEYQTLNGYITILN